MSEPKNHPHLIDGEFQSDKYPTTPRGLVPLKPTDPMAQDLLWIYAQRRRAIDPQFADDLEAALIAKGYSLRSCDEDLDRALADAGDLADPAAEGLTVSIKRFASALTEIRSARATIRKLSTELRKRKIEASSTVRMALAELVSAFDHFCESANSRESPASFDRLSAAVDSFRPGHYPTRADTFDEMVIAERRRQDEEFPPERNGKVHGPDTWYLVLGEEAGEIARAILEWRATPNANALQVLKETVELAASCRAFIEHDPIFSFLDPAPEPVPVHVGADWARGESELVTVWPERRGPMPALDDPPGGGEWRPIYQADGPPKGHVAIALPPVQTVSVTPLTDRAGVVFEGFDGKEIKTEGRRTCSRCGGVEGIALPMCSKTRFAEPHDFKPAHATSDVPNPGGLTSEQWDAAIPPDEGAPDVD